MVLIRSYIPKSIDDVAAGQSGKQHVFAKCNAFGTEPYRVPPPTEPLNCGMWKPGNVPLLEVKDAGNETIIT